jgi:hypothetical protein
MPHARTHTTHTRVSARSPTFAWGVLERLAEMVHGLSAAPRDKMKLVHMLRRMHHDPAMAQQSRAICEELLEDYPGEFALFISFLPLAHFCFSSHATHTHDTHARHRESVYGDGVGRPH